MCQFGNHVCQQFCFILAHLKECNSFFFDLRPAQEVVFRFIRLGRSVYSFYQLSPLVSVLKIGFKFSKSEELFSLHALLAQVGLLIP